MLLVFCNKFLSCAMVFLGDWLAGRFIRITELDEQLINDIFEVLAIIKRKRPQQGEEESTQARLVVSGQPLYGPVLRPRQPPLWSSVTITSAPSMVQCYHHVSPLYGPVLPSRQPPLWSSTETTSAPSMVQY